METPHLAHQHQDLVAGEHPVVVHVALLEELRCSVQSVLLQEHTPLGVQFSAQATTWIWEPVQERHRDTTTLERSA